jgi:hypothetical protein
VRRRKDGRVGYLAQRLVQRQQALRVYPIVIGNENVHRVSFFYGFQNQRLSVEICVLEANEPDYNRVQIAVKPPKIEKRWIYSVVFLEIDALQVFNILKIRMLSRPFA